MKEQYNIKYSSMDQFYVNVCTRIQEWYEQLDEWKARYTNFVNMSDFTGQSATAVKSYMGEVHELLLQSIYVAISRFQSDYLLYKNQYYDIESNIYAVMPKETIKSIEKRLSKEITYLNNISNDINSSLNSVSDIFWRGKPSRATLEYCLSLEKNALGILSNKIENYEHTKYVIANGALKKLLEILRSTIISYRYSNNSVVSYKSGDLRNNTQVLELCEKVQSSTKYIQKKQEEIELAAAHQQEVFAQMQKDYEEACEAREEEGLMKIITGASAIIVGGAAIICTAGAATPIVVTAAVTGTCSVAYGTSNMIEGGQDVYYGAVGDLSSTAINPIRDTVFMGNQGAYDIWGNLNMTVAGLCIPVSQSVNGVAGASKTVIAKTAIKTIGKELTVDQSVDIVSNGITKYATEKLHLGQAEAFILNMGLNMGISKGADAVGTKLSGKASLVEGMDYDDAIRYNKCWENMEAGKSTGHPGLSEADIKAWKFADRKVDEHIAISKVDTDAIVELRAKEAVVHNKFLNGDVGKMEGGSDSFGVYSTKIDNKVTVIDKQELPGWLGKTFKDGNYRTVVTNEEIVVYRSFGYNAEAGGAFATSSPALNRIQTKIDSAILPEWKNTLRYEAEIVIPKGSTLNIGRVEEQFTMSGARLAGDVDQFLLPENWDLNWIKSIREVRP